MRGPRAWLTAVLAVLTVAVGGCSTSAGSDPSTAAPNDVRIIFPAAAFTAKNLVDWKSLGDVIAIIQITDSRVDHSAAGDPARNGGTFGRLAQVSVLQVLWRRDPAVVPPSVYLMRVWGWRQLGNEKQAIVAHGEPRFEVGHTYLVVLAKFKSGWAGLGDGAEVPFDNGTVGAGEWEGNDPSDKTPAVQALLGKNAAQVQQIIDATQPDPRAAQYGNLDPLERAKKLGAHS